MKTAEQLLKEKGIRPKTIHHNYDYVYRAVYDIIEQAQKEAYNQAIDDAIRNVTLSLFDYEIGGFKEYKIKYSHYIINDGNYIEVDKDSILKLKK